MTMGKRQVYAFAGQTLDLLPGVTVHVLGPPTLDQSEDIRTMRSRDADEFWQLQAATEPLAARQGEGRFGDDASTCEPPLEARWFCRHVAQARSDGLLRIVRALDAQMNNTSLILLFEVAGRFFLFPGDAQIENWQYALAQSEVRERLAQVELYKVGHHGSRNATPRTLWGLFERKGGKERPDRLTTLVSTKAGKHGDPKNKSEVPRTTLVRELKRQSRYRTTERLVSIAPDVITIPLA
jgi:hypothetical protein